MRIPTLICALAIAAPGALPGQEGKWTGTLAAGCGQGVGDAGGGRAWRPFAGAGVGEAHPFVGTEWPRLA